MIFHAVFFGREREKHGAVQMSEALLAAPKKQQDPQVAAWAKQIIKAQKEEIEQMKAWLKDVGGLDQQAYDAMRHDMQNMMHMYTSKNPNVQFVQQMLPHHGMAVTMTVPVLSVNLKHECPIHWIFMTTFPPDNRMSCIRASEHFPDCRLRAGTDSAPLH